MADSFVPGVSQLCRARKLFRFFAICFLIGILGSPNRTSRTLPSSFASTADFLDAPGVDLGLLYPANFWPRYVIILPSVAHTTQLESSPSMAQTAYRRGRTRKRWPARALLAAPGHRLGPGSLLSGNPGRWAIRSARSVLRGLGAFPSSTVGVGVSRIQSRNAFTSW